MATTATGDAGLETFFTVAGATERVLLAEFNVVVGLAMGIAVGASGIVLADVAANAACLNSIAFKCPRAAMIQSVSPKKAMKW